MFSRAHVMMLEIILKQRIFRDEAALCCILQLSRATFLLIFFSGKIERSAYKCRDIYGHLCIRDIPDLNVRKNPFLFMTDSCHSLFVKSRDTNHCAFLVTAALSSTFRSFRSACNRLTDPHRWLNDLL